MLLLDRGQVNMEYFLRDFCIFNLSKSILYDSLLEMKKSAQIMVIGLNFFSIENA